MKTWVRKTIGVGVLAAGALLFAPSAVQADPGQVSIDNDGIANGNQAYVPVQVPVNVCGNGVGAILGHGVGFSGACVNGAAQHVDHKKQHVDRKKSKRKDAAQVSADNDGILNGNQLQVPVQVPINICGNGVGILGAGAGSSGACIDGAVHDAKAGKSRKAHTKDAAQVSADNDGILNGNQAYVPIQVPINVCGNGLGAILGIGLGASGACFNGAAQDVDWRDGHPGHDGAVPTEEPAEIS